MQAVDDEQWNLLRGELKREYEELREHGASTQALPSEVWILGMMVIPAHALYHLGAIRQIMKSAKTALR